MRQFDLGRVLIYFTYALVSIAELLLLTRIILRLFGANPIAPFVQWIYETTDTLLSPFRGIFPTTTISQNFVIDFSTLFAVLVYGFFAYLISILIDALDSRRTVVVPK